MEEDEAFEFHGEYGEGLNSAAVLGGGGGAAFGVLDSDEATDGFDELSMDGACGFLVLLGESFSSGEAEAEGALVSGGEGVFEVPLFSREGVEEFEAEVIV